MHVKRTVLVVLDGFGERAESDGNAIRLARTPTFDALYREFPHTLDQHVRARRRAARRSDGQQRSRPHEHGLGAHRLPGADAHQQVDQRRRLLREPRARRRHRQGQGERQGAAPARAHEPGRRALVARARLRARRAGQARAGSTKVYWHAFLDGRDTPPKSARQLPAPGRAPSSAQIGVGRIATVVGRYYAMDRDNRWDRVQLAYRPADARRRARPSATPPPPSSSATRAGETDEFIKPIVDRRRRGHARRRRLGRLLQLPRRPRARAHARA